MTSDQTTEPAFYAWTEVEPDGREGLIIAAHPLLGNTAVPLQHRRRDLVESFRDVALQHGERTKRKVRLVALTRTGILEEHDPPTNGHT